MARFVFVVLLAAVLCLGIASVHGQTAYITANLNFTVFTGDCSVCALDSPCSLPIAAVGQNIILPLSDACDAVVFLADDYPRTAVTIERSVTAAGTTIVSSTGVVNFLYDSFYQGYSQMAFYGGLKFENFTAVNFRIYAVSRLPIVFENCNITWAKSAYIVPSAAVAMTWRNCHFKFPSDPLTLDSNQNGQHISLTIDTCILEPVSSTPGYIQWTRNLADPITVTNSYIHNMRFFQSGSFSATHSILSRNTSIGLLVSTAAGSDFTLIDTIMNGTSDALVPLPSFPMGNILLQRVTWDYPTGLYDFDEGTPTYVSSVTLEDVKVSMTAAAPFIGINAVYPSTTNSVDLKITGSEIYSQTQNSFFTVYVDLASTEILNFETSSSTYSGTNAALVLPENVNITASSRLDSFLMGSTNGTTFSGADLELNGTVGATQSGVPSIPVTLNNTRTTIETTFYSEYSVVVLEATTLVYRPLNSEGLTYGITVAHLNASAFGLDLSLVTPTYNTSFILAPAYHEISYTQASSAAPPAHDVHTSYSGSRSRYSIDAPTDPVAPIAPTAPAQPQAPAPHSAGTILHFSASAVFGAILLSALFL